MVFIGVDYVDAEPNTLAYIDEFDITYPNGPDLGQKIAKTYRIKGERYCPGRSIAHAFFISDAVQRPFDKKVQMVNPFAGVTRAGIL